MSTWRLRSAASTQPLPPPHTTTPLLCAVLSSPGDVSPTGRYVFSEYFIEAPALFYRAGLYYAVFGHCW